ncbi:phosphoribosylpyrophosphate synthetase [Petrocella atlantisensis]|uniref:Ribose-phosphate pyrophosphokinase n=1 Tax=Petrocella atlantisensis TaxID=2173034 RepID=A0A3P7PF82_9FIRM|nr:ribose-phosphate pyrophosphokinase [Petrocella atlantisensis]MCF8017947.1 ribose-phosphate pyrophosphokinase [Vallitaleaceae bacterium]VDN47568.1 phosphoribosylpyrophosphate synthetase [Petrocella atlantisensis]
MTSVIRNNDGIKVFSGGANQELAINIAKSLGTELSIAEVGKFSDGESYVKIGEMVRGVDCFIIQPTSFPVNDTLMETLIMIDALRRASAGRITAVMPYYGYARQDRKARARDPITARLVADMLQTAGCDRVLTMDLHCAQIQGFFTIPVDHMLGNPLLIKYYREKFHDKKEDLVICSPDIGSVKRSRSFAEAIDVPIAIIDKRRPEDNVSEVMHIIGDVKGKKVILVDDMIDTAGTICNAANALYDQGATEIYACCTHPVLSGPAIERITKSAIKELVVLDTIALPEGKKTDKIKQLSVADILADAISRIHHNESVSKLFV